VPLSSPFIATAELEERKNLPFLGDSIEIDDQILPGPIDQIATSRAKEPQKQSKCDFKP
jgi:hypothetical protein